MKNNYYKLNNGVLIPKIGFGTWQIQNGEDAYNSCLYALKVGYRHIDTANAYGNEESVGRAIKDSGIKREEVFVTSKLRAEKKGYEVALEEFDKTLSNLDLDYIDLYLIHAPRPWGDTSNKDYTKENIQSYKAMEKLYKEGKIRSIGVSNFSKEDIQAIIDNCEIVPAVNQIRFHIGYMQEETVDYCLKHNILVEAYSPFATGRIFKNENVINVSKKYDLDIAKMCLKWCLNHNTLPLPKSTDESRILNNYELNITINEEAMKELDKIKI